MIDARQRAERGTALAGAGGGRTARGRSRGAARFACGALLLLLLVRAGDAGSSLAVTPGALLRTGVLLQTPGPPAAPTGLWVGAISPSMVGLNWMGPSADETGFEVWRKVGTGDWTRLGEAPAHAIHFVDATVMPDVPYTYRVRAHNDLLASDWSNEASITIPRLPPPPTGLTAAAVAATAVQLKWAGASDNGSFTTIWRKSAVGGSDFVPIASSEGSDTGYTDQTADPNTRYLYRARAETSYYRSDWSNEAAVATPAPPAGVVVQAAVPPEAAGPDTPVLLSYSLPDGYRLDCNPFVVVLNPAGALFELLPASLTQPSPNGEGHRDLHTELYPAGVYQVRAQLSLLDASGQSGGAASPWMPLTVPPSAVAAITLPPTITARQSVPGTVSLAGGSRSQPAVVTLASSNPAVAAVPASVSIPPWSVAATFALTAGAVTAPTTVTITASYNGTSLSAALTVTPAGGPPAARRTAASRPFQPRPPAGARLPGRNAARVAIGRRDQLENLFGAPLRAQTCRRMATG